jgi:hypothetical protein
MGRAKMKPESRKGTMMREEFVHTMTVLCRAPKPKDRKQPNAAVERKTEKTGQTAWSDRMSNNPKIEALGRWSATRGAVEKPGQNHARCLANRFVRWRRGCALELSLVRPYSCQSYW